MISRFSWQGTLDCGELTSRPRPESTGQTLLHRPDIDRRLHALYHVHDNCHLQGSALDDAAAMGLVWKPGGTGIDAPDDTPRSWYSDCPRIARPGDGRPPAPDPRISAVVVAPARPGDDPLRVLRRGFERRGLRMGDLPGDRVGTLRVRDSRVFGGGRHPPVCVSRVRPIGPGVVDLGRPGGFLLCAGAGVGLGLRVADRPRRTASRGLLRQPLGLPRRTPFGRRDGLAPPDERGSA